MDSSNFNDKIEKLRKIIEEKAILSGDNIKIVTKIGKKGSFFIDLKSVFFDPDSLDLISDIFWEKFEKEYPFQIGGQELAAVPLITALILKGRQLQKNTNSFVIRKTRKTSGMQNIIEGELNNKKIILVDDLINSGSTILHQIKVLDKIGKKTDLVFTLINCKNKINEKLIHEHNARLEFLFTSSDFGLPPSKDEKPNKSLSQVWKFECSEPNFFYAVPKSTPCLDENKLYFGSDCDYFWALNQKDGSVAWKFKVGTNPDFCKSIFSSPTIYKNIVYFGSYDGNVYALDKETGKFIWKYSEADYVGSSPVISCDLKCLFIGLEFGLFRKRGGIASLDLESGKEIWSHHLTDYVHSTPAYCPEKKLVAVGCNDAYVYVFNAKNGKLKWKYKTRGSIKGSFVFDIKRNMLLFGSFDNNFYALDLDSGNIRGSFLTKDSIYSTPLLNKDNAYFSSTDKNLYCINLDSGNLLWLFSAKGRILSSPKIIEGRVVIGSNDGIMYELDALNGQIISFFQTTERITNSITYNPKTKLYFVSTYANEIYCLKK